MRTDVYERVTNQIITALEAGVKPWHQPWSGNYASGRITHPLRGNGIRYRGINVIMLWSEAMAKGYRAPIWMTFKQALELKAHVRKGETGSLVVYANSITRTETDRDTGEESERAIPFLKGYTVFNVEQIEGLPEHFYGKPEPRKDLIHRIDHVETFVKATKADVRHGGHRAFYSPAHDLVQMPPFEAFQDAESYYAVLIHELTHWTKHTSRLDRDFGRKRWGDAGYAAEELVAELGAAFVLADLDFAPQARPEHAAYIGSWLKVLKNDKRAIFTAASYAQRAADYLHGLQSDRQMEASREEAA